MICGANTCNADYLDKLVFEQEEQEDDDDFIKSLKHVKCKLIQLVRAQVRKSQEKPGNLCCRTQFNSTAELYEAFPLERKSTKYLIFNEKNSKEEPATLRQLLPTNPPKSVTPNRRITAPRLRNSRRRLYYIILLIAAILAILFAMHFFLIRGYFCNKGQPCVTTFRYTHAKHALF